MVATAPMLPDTAPFERGDIDLLNRVMARTTPNQRQWLAGFLAGFAAASGAAVPARAPAPAAPAQPKTPLTILYATESGNSEKLAGQAKKAANKLGFDAKVADMADVTPEQVAKAANLLTIAATWGEGDPPQRAADFMSALAAPDAPRFDKTRFAVLALGDRAYVQYCETGRRLDERLAELGGARIADRIDLDLDYEVPATDWIGRVLPLWKPKDEPAQVIRVDFARAAPHKEDKAEPSWTKAHPFEAELSEIVELSSSRSESRTFHAEIAFGGSGLTYEPGDALGLLPANDDRLVDEIATLARGNDALHADLAQHDVTTLTAPAAAKVAELSGNAELKAIVTDPARWQAWSADRQLIDLLTTPGLTLNPDTLRGLLRPLPTRLYSIASAQSAVGEEAHLTVAEVAWASHGRERLGVTSGWLARLKAGASIRTYIHPNKHFRLPTDTAAPVIMIGPGTGVAPFRGFIQHREATGATGKNWLFFGHRRFTHDFLYQLEWQDALQSGALSRLSLAFSRDQRAKRYVQHALWEEGRELMRWIDDGAHLYVCGDANRMAKDVDAMLARIFAQAHGKTEQDGAAELKLLAKAGRYLKDVY